MQIKCIIGAWGADADHVFTAREVDWGFTTFMALEDLEPPERGFIVNNTLKVSLLLEATAAITP